MARRNIGGRMAAAEDLGRTALNPEVIRVIENYQRLSTDDDRAHYADHFIRRTAGVMDDIWPIFYQLLKQIKDDKLYTKPSYTRGETFCSFEEYFEQVAGRPFETWADLESTYQYVQECKPWLLTERLHVARAEAVKAKTEALDGKTINSGDGPIPKGDNDNCDIITVRGEGNGGGTSADYLTRRIVRDHPDIAEKMRNGEYRSVRQAALDAGIVPPSFTVRGHDPEKIAATLRRQLPEDILKQVINHLEGW